MKSNNNTANKFRQLCNTFYCTSENVNISQIDKNEHKIIYNDY